MLVNAVYLPKNPTCLTHHENRKKKHVSVLGFWFSLLFAVFRHSKNITPTSAGIYLKKSIAQKLFPIFHMVSYGHFSNSFLTLRNCSDVMYRPSIAGTEKEDNTWCKVQMETHPTCGDDGVFENIAAQLAAEFY